LRILREGRPVQRRLTIPEGLTARQIAALTLRAEGHDGPVLLVGEEPEEPYRRPPLSKDLLLGRTPPERVRLRPTETWADQNIDLRTGTTAVGLDPAARTVTLSDGSLVRYGRLLLATGGRPRPLPRSLLPGPRPRRVRALRSLADALRLRDDLARAGSLLVIGAGLIGLEVAATARALGCEVTVLEAAGVPLSRVAPPWLGALYTELHRSNGVDLHMGVRLTRVREDGDSVTATADDGRSWSAALAVAAVGMVPETSLAARSGVYVSTAPNGGIVVDEFCRTSTPDVFAAGDVTDQPHPLLGGHYRVEHWNNAQDQGAAAARNMLGRRTAYAPEPWCWSEQYGTRLQICGWPAAADSYGERRLTLRGDPSAMDFTAVFWRDGRVVGGVSAGRPAEFRALRRILATDPYPDFDALADPDTDLASLTPPVASR
ncbi:MAG TPA: FAD-dependent oxidoreductase, partial [Thermomonospora sp.]|nr:FAD-dependent oxidoreductase [Thermomonospora sp.]